MSGFQEFKVKIKEKFDEMSKQNLFVTGIEKDKLWETYLGSFPEGANPIYKERTEHDCQCCKQFIRACGNVVAITPEGKLMSIWDIDMPGTAYQEVADELAVAVRQYEIKDGFLHYQNNLGTDFNHQDLESGEIKKWEHFHYKLPNKFVKTNDAIATILSSQRANKEVLKRSFEEISIEAVETVLELIGQNSLYRGDEFKRVVQLLLKHKKEYDTIGNKDTYCWTTSRELGETSRFRNTAIGTLLVNLSENMELDHAVRAFETIVAPTNYKRPTALITKSMIENAQKTVEELGIKEALTRRYAVMDDITINNVLFANRDAKKVMDVFDELANEAPVNIKNLDKVEEVTIETFVQNILPKAENIEFFFENKHGGNLVSLIAPVDNSAKNILKWNNNFSWSYKGEVTDSVRDRVKNAGGRVDGVFRFSHSWNELESNQSLMDLHVFMPENAHYKDRKVHDLYGNNERVGWNNRTHSKSGGSQDVDYTSQAPEGYVPVENITFPSLNRMPEGKYICKIHNWDFRNSGGKGSAEIEFDGNVYEYIYPSTKNKEWITIAEVVLKGGKFNIDHKLSSSAASKEAWNIKTQTFQKASMIMHSPNHWDGNQTGNMHYFFMLEDCKNPEPSRGFYNEFLKEDLKEHRKVFEVLGSKMKTEISDKQLSGLGFSSTQRNSILCKVSGSFSRTIKINF